MQLNHDQEQGAAFVIAIATALHRFGAPSHRLESALVGMSAKLGLQGQFFSTPTALMIGFGPPANQRTAILRVQPGGVDLAKLADLDALADAVVAGELGLVDGIARAEAIVAHRPRWGPAVQIVAYALASAAAARFFGGGVGEIATAGAAGVGVGVLAALLASSGAGQHVFELVAALLAAGIGYAASALGLPVDHRVATLAGLIVLVPGLTLTVAMVELATRNLVSGTARLTAAAIVFLKMGFGVALAEALLSRMLGPPGALASAPLPGWTEPIALVLAGAAFATLFQAHARAIPGIIVACAAAFYGARLGALAIGPALGASLGAFLVGSGSNAWARLADRPALVPLVPGILLLVPGSIGFRSMSSLLAGDVITGVDTAFTMTLVAVSIVVGLLVANAVVSPQRNL